MARSLPESEVAKLYDRLGFSYDFWGRLTDSLAHRKALELAEIHDGESLLEIGVGTALLFAQLAARNPHGHSVGLDVSNEMLRLGARKVASLPGRILLNLGSALQLPYPDTRFDLLVSAYVLDLIADDLQPSTLREWSRVTRPGGRLLLLNWCHGTRWYNRFWEMFPRLHPKIMGGCRPLNPAPYLEQGGWTLVYRTEISQMTSPSEIVLARKPPE